MATAAVKAAAGLFGALENVSALLIGPSEMGLLMVDHFQNGGLRRITVAGRTAARGDALAQIVGGLALGALSDRSLGHRGLLLLSFVGAATAYATAELLTVAMAPTATPPPSASRARSSSGSCPS